MISSSQWYVTISDKLAMSATRVILPANFGPTISRKCMKTLMHPTNSWEAQAHSSIPPSCTVGQFLQLRRSIDSRICWIFFTHELLCTSLKASHCSRIVTSHWSNWRIILQVLPPDPSVLTQPKTPPGKNFTKAPQIGEIRAKASRASIQVKPPVIEAYLERQAIGIPSNPAHLEGE